MPRADISSEQYVTTWYSVPRTFLLVHVLLHALRARAALREEGLVVVRGRELRAHARAHLAQQLDAARRYLVRALRYYLIQHRR